LQLEGIMRLNRAIFAALITCTLAACGHSTGVPTLAQPPIQPAQSTFAIPDIIVNRIVNGSFESPLVPLRSFRLFSTGQTFTGWKVVGHAGNVAIVKGGFSQNGFTFPAGCGTQFLDLTGTSNTPTGVAQTIATVRNSTHMLTFKVGNVYNPGGIFGTTSTVKVLVNGVLLMTARNTMGAAVPSHVVWEQFSKTFVAATTSTTLSFINADPASDTANGLDCITMT
jgi:hypothetical protein